MLLIALAMAAFTCPYADHQWTSILASRDLPQEILYMLGKFANRDEGFNPSDVAFPNSAPQRRFVNARASGCEIILNYEQGGRGRTMITKKFIFEVDHWVVKSK